MTDAPAFTARPSLMPADTPDYMAPAWVGCMHWALGHAETRSAFEAETGHHWQPAKSGLDRMIDEAPGSGNAYVEAFVRWANIAVWGPMGGDDEIEAAPGKGGVTAGGKLG